MRTTLNIDDRLYRATKVRAAREDRTVTDLVETALRGFLQDVPSRLGGTGAENSEVNFFPTIKTRPLQADQHKAPSIDEVGEQVKKTELSSDIERHEKIFGH